MTLLPGSQASDRCLLGNLFIVSDRLLLFRVFFSENKQLHRYWQNEFHTMDNSISSKDVLTTTFGNSFIRRSMHTYRRCGRLADLHLIETHILNYNDNFDRYETPFDNNLHVYCRTP